MSRFTLANEVEPCDRWGIVTTITCEACSFSQDVCHGGAKAYWLAEGKYALLNSQMCWCTNCQRITEAERLPSVDDITREFIAVQRGLQDGDTASARIDWHEARSAFVTASETLAPESYEILLENTLDWRAERKSAARCLECSSTDILTLSRGWTSWKHPGCGGNLVPGGFGQFTGPCLKFMANGTRADPQPVVGERATLASLERWNPRFDVDFDGHIIEVELYGREVTDSAVRLLAALPFLRRLTLEYTSVTDDGAEVISGLHELQFLSLYYAPVGDHGVERLSAMSNLSDDTLSTVVSVRDHQQGGLRG